MSFIQLKCMYFKFHYTGEVSYFVPPYKRYLLVSVVYGLLCQ